jgi:hypothetical protein
MTQNIQTRPTADLIPFASNARLHSDGQIVAIAGSIREFGFNNPVLIAPDNTIIAGHGRVMAAKKLGLETVPVIVLAHLTEAQRRAYVIADNRLAETGGGWDWQMLRAELDHIAELGDIDIGLTGFDPEDLPSGDMESFEVDGDEQRGGTDTNYLSFGDRKVPLDADELTGLMALLDNHMAKTGSPFGFASALIRKCST